jgi:hypothetical protein
VGDADDVVKQRGGVAAGERDREPARDDRQDGTEVQEGENDEVGDRE